ncbi:hypothetical protein KA068_02680 [Candidatus Saccharibacteria bacterium]|jgi:hypothetical protein|nr:hypothetical protein [Candidatus Saccharibacteria bacterium]
MAGLAITFGTNIFDSSSFAVEQNIELKNSILYVLVASLLAVLISLIGNVAILWSSQGKKFTTSELWSGGIKFLPRLLGLSVLVGIVVLLGFILFIIPGIFMIKRYYLSVYYLIDQDLSVTDAMSASAKVSKQPGAVWGLLGVTLLLSFTQVIPAIGGIVSFVLGAMYAAAPAIRYNQLKGPMATSEEQPAASNAPTPLAPAN